MTKIKFNHNLEKT